MTGRTEEDSERNYKALSLYDNWLRPSTRTPALTGNKFTILVDLSMVIFSMHLVCLIYAWK